VLSSQIEQYSLIINEFRGINLIRITTTRCPHRNYRLHYGVNDNGKQFGCMIQTCPSCRKQYFASNYIEIALRGKEYYYRKEPKRWFVIMLYTFMAITFCYAILYVFNIILFKQEILKIVFIFGVAAWITLSIYSFFTTGIYINDREKFEEEA
jgi:hypothetical protein